MTGIKITPVTVKGLDHLVFDLEIDGEDQGRYNTIEAAQRWRDIFLRGAVHSAQINEAMGLTQA